MARYRNFDGALGAATDVHALPPALDDVRLRRAGLKAALSGLELALAAPFANRVDWVMHVRDALDAVHEVWTRHIVETEAPGAFLDELVTEAPRLSTPTSRLRREHSEILATIVRGGEAPRDAAGRGRRLRGVGRGDPRRAHRAPRGVGPASPAGRRPRVRGVRGRPRRRLLQTLSTWLLFVVLVERLAAAEDAPRCARRWAARGGSGCGRRGTARRPRGSAPTPRIPRATPCAWRTPASTVWNQWNSASSTMSARPSAAIRSARDPPARKKPYASFAASSIIPWASKQRFMASMLPLVVCGRRAAGTLRKRSR